MNFLRNIKKLNQIVRLCQEYVHIQSDDPEHLRQANTKSGGNKTKNLQVPHHVVGQDSKSSVVLHDVTNKLTY